MDQVRVFEAERGAEPAMEPPPAIGTDERRMHVRAYKHWVSLLAGHHYPRIDDLRPEALPDFGPHSVLLDFTAGADHPAIPYIGHAILAEGGYPSAPGSIADVPPGSLLSRLTDHYLEIIANRSPIGFEAEFVNAAGANTLYRGILMPFSSDDETIDFIYGVINWKVVADAGEVAAIAAGVGRIGTAPPKPPVSVWADGPRSEPEQAREVAEVVEAIDDGLHDRLAAARESASLVRSADLRSRGALYRTLCCAYDFALAAEASPGDYRELLDGAGLKVQARAPMTPVVKLVFGSDYDKTRVTEFAAALAYGRRHDLGRGGLRKFLETHDGGLKGVVAAERIHRRKPFPETAEAPDPRARLRTVAPCGFVTLPSDDDAEFMLLLGRREGDGRVAVLAPVAHEAAALERVLRRAAA